MKITLGNAAPIEVHHHDPDNAVHQQRLERRGGQVVESGGGALHVIPLDPVVSNETEVIFHNDPTAREAIATALHLWTYHSNSPAGWLLVEDDNAARGNIVRQLLSDEWGLAVPAGVTMLVTNAGLDYASKQLGGAASATAVAVNMALTNDSTAPAATDTVLASEYNHASAGLNRKAAAYAHTTGATTYTLTATFTANASDVLPFTANKMGLFDATSSGNMPIETSISPAITWNASGDAGTITETITV